MKLILLEGRILVYSQNSKTLSEYMYSILGLFQGLLTFKYADTKPILRQHLAYGQYGLPLHVFNQNCHFIPMFNLSELDLFDKYTGFVAGTTN